MIDADTKKKWDEAKDGKETTTALIAVHEMVLHIFKEVNNCAAGELVQLVGQYADLSLAGSCSALVKSGVRFLEVREKEIKNVWHPRPYELVAVRESLDHMKKKLELLNDIEDTQKGVPG